MYPFCAPSISHQHVPLVTLFCSNFLIQVTGQIKLIDGGSICFGLSENPISEFELVAEELLMSDSVIKAWAIFCVLHCS